MKLTPQQGEVLADLIEGDPMDPAIEPLGEPGTYGTILANVRTVMFLIYEDGRTVRMDDAEPLP